MSGRKPKLRNSCKRPGQENSSRGGEGAKTQLSNILHQKIDITCLCVLREKKKYMMIKKQKKIKIDFVFSDAEKKSLMNIFFF